MRRRTMLALAVTLVVLVGATGVTAAQPNGPPDESPSPVPDFVTDVLGAISDFVGGLIGSLGEAVSGLTPGGDAAPVGNPVA